MARCLACLDHLGHPLMIQLLHDVGLLAHSPPPIVIFEEGFVEDLDGHLPPCELVHGEGYPTEGPLAYQLDESIVTHLGLMRHA